MKIDVSLPFQASLSFENETLKVVGSKNLLLQVEALQKTFGLNPKAWPLIKNTKTSEDMLINQFVAKINERAPIYNYDELCHCRMVKTETVIHAIVAGARTVAEISRTTLAGTGCGSCRADAEKLLNEILNPK